MLEWTIPLMTAVLGAVAAVLVAVINKRRNRAGPEERIDTFIGQIQDDRQAGREQLATMTNIATQFMSEAVAERSHSSALDDWSRAIDHWIDAGMPNPPGKPLRPIR